MWRKLADVAFWIGISLYFGGLIALGAIAAPAVFKTARDLPLSMPGIADPPLNTANQVGGEVFGEILARFAYVEALALALTLIGIAIWILGHRHVRRSTWIVLILWTLIAAIATIDAAWLRPKVWSLRTTIRQQASAHVAPAATAPGAWPEYQQFDSLHKWDETLGRAKIYLLLGMILVIAWRGLAEKRNPNAPDGPEVLRRTMGKQT
jgi:hypothetical protein